jgi:hypothetical protein
MSSELHTEVDSPLVEEVLAAARRQTLADVPEPVHAASRRRVLERLREPPRGAGWLPVALAGAALVASVVAAPFVLSSRESIRNDVARSATTAATAAPSETVKVIVRVVPSNAQVYWDGAPMSNPAIFKVPRESSQHRVRVEAPGFESRELLVTAAADVILDFALQRSGEPRQLRYHERGPIP